MCRSFCSISALFLSFWLLICGQVEALVNVTIDDTYGDPKTGIQIVYTPSDGWNLGQSCSGCSARPNVSLAYNGSWHDSSYHPNDTGGYSKAEVTFTGTAVYVYGIKGYGSGDFATRDLTFQIDGVEVGTYTNVNIFGSGWIYDYLFFSRKGLSNSEHTLSILNGMNLGPDVSLFLLDSIVYSYEETTTWPAKAAVSKAPRPHITTVLSSSHPASSHTTSNTTSISTTSELASARAGGALATSASTTTISATTTIADASPPSGTNTSSTNDKTTIVIIVTLAVSILFVLGTFVWYIRRSRRHNSASLHGTNASPCTPHVSPTSQETMARVEASSPSIFALFRTQHPPVEPFRPNTMTITINAEKLRQEHSGRRGEEWVRQQLDGEMTLEDEAPPPYLQSSRLRDRSSLCL